MTIKQQGGIFGRNPTFNDVDVTTINTTGDASIGDQLAVGTTEQNGQLHVYSGDSGASRNSNCNVFIENNGAAGISIGTPSSASGFIMFADEGGTGRGHIQYDHTDDSLAFSANGSSRAEINSSGNLLVGTTANNARLTVQAGSSDEAGYFRPNVIDSGSGSEPVTVKAISQKNPCLDLNRYYSFGTIVQFRQNNDAVGSISVTSTATTYNTSSDYRLKENVTDLTGAITRLQQLNPKRFNFTADPNTTVDGFLAHEAATAVPEAVTGTKDATQAIGDITDADGNVVKTGVPQVNVPEGHTWTATGTEPVYQGIDQSKLVPLLVAALQEAVARIEALENA